MRTEEFKMERLGNIKIGDEVTITERSTTAFYYYIIMPALAMSGNYSLGQRIKSTTGKVSDIREDDRGWFAYVDFEN